MNIFPNTPNFDILGQRRFWYGVSLFLTIATFLTPLVKKPNWGVDFAGGTELQVRFTGDVDPGKIREALEGAGVVDPSVQPAGRNLVGGGDAEGTNPGFLIRVRNASLFTNEAFEKELEPKLRAALPGLSEGRVGISYDEQAGDQVTVRAKAEGALTADAVRQAFEGAGLRLQEVRAITDGTMYSVLLRGVSDKVESALEAKFASLRPAGEKGFVTSVDQVGASVGTELRYAAIKALLIAILLILLYIGFRFDFAFATGAVISLAHDAVIVVGFYLVSGAELNTSSIAAVLTIVGYSVNDTVIIYDRIRENMQKHKGRELYRLINDSINETLSRTIITHFTVMLSLSGLILFTVGSLREFALAMFVGVITGTYSSVYVASPLVIWIEDVLAARKGVAEAGASEPSLSATERVRLLSYLVLGVLVGLALENLLSSVSGVSFLGFLRSSLFGLEGWTYATVLGYGLAAAIGVFAWRDPRVKEPATQVVEEMSRVTWPTLAETRAATYAVIVATLVCAAMLGLFDYGWGMLTQSVYGAH